MVTEKDKMTLRWLGLYAAFADQKKLLKHRDAFAPQEMG